jgi:hypothetical protein
MFETMKTAAAVIGIDIGKNSFHVVGLDQRGAIALRQRWSRASGPRPWFAGTVLDFDRSGVGDPDGTAGDPQTKPLASGLSADLHR